MYLQLLALIFFCKSWSRSTPAEFPVLELVLQSCFWLLPTVSEFAGLGVPRTAEDLAQA